MATFAFAGATASTPAFGHKTKVRFGGTWVAGDSWTTRFISTLSGNFTLGKGNIAGQIYTCGFKLRNRVYVGFSNSFAMSSIEGPDLWEEQDAGAAVVAFLSQFGPQDVVTAYASIQGRLAVFGRKSIQIWQADADPALFQLLQTLNNIGTQDPETVQNIGDLDVMFLHDSGFRSLRAREATLNAYVNDVGTPIDSLIEAALLEYTAGTACGIVEPTSAQYWGCIGDVIYVLSQHPESKVTAWSTYKPTYQETITPQSATYQPPGITLYSVEVGGTYYWSKGAGATRLQYDDNTPIITSSGFFVATGAVVGETGTVFAPVESLFYRIDTPFTPVKMVVHNGQVFIRGSDRKLYQYGGADNNTYDYSLVTVELPRLDMGMPSVRKTLTGVDAAFSGRWQLYVSTQTKASTYRQVADRGSDTDPDMEDDSTYDKERFPAGGTGTHIQTKMTSVAKGAARLGAINFIYSAAGTK